LDNSLSLVFVNANYETAGLIETVKGILAFVACPMFGRLSDIIGRKRCLLLTVLGTTLPICVLSLTSSLWTFLAFQALSGMFAATFPLTFAYIADFVPREKRAPAYGMALATFGLSFSIGPIIGGYLARALGARSVFICSTLLVAVDVAYITLILPESMLLKAAPASCRSNASNSSNGNGSNGKRSGLFVKIPAVLRRGTPGYQDGCSADDSTDYLPFQWNPLHSLQAFQGNPLLHRITVIVFLYYTAVWAVVSTLMVYVTRKFHFSAVTVGQLLSAHGLTTMFAEGKKRLPQRSCSGYLQVHL
jgi:MFS transporter, DHA1 family, tetracycline resistance protein